MNPPAPSHLSSPKGRAGWAETIPSLALLAAVLWVARYALSARFGLYEDDYTIVPAAAAWTPGETLTFIGGYIAGLRGHARPLSDSAIYLLTNLGWRFGGLTALYFIGWLTTALNAGLFWALLRRWYGREVAFIGGLAYVLFSADTTQAFLTHSLGLQPSLTLLLLSFHVYNTRARPLAYLLAGVILFAYETPYLLFLVAPLIDGRWERGVVRRLGFHVVLVAGLLTAVIALRASVGEERVTGLAWPTAVAVATEHMLVGPAVSLGSYVLRGVQLAASGSSQGWVAFGAAWALLGPLLFWLSLRERTSHDRDAGFADDRQRGSLWRLGVLGLATIALAYPLTFTTRAAAISGRETRVHLAAVVGASMILAALGAAWLRRAREGWRRWAVAGGLGALFAGLVGFGFLIQQDYIRSWDLQRAFWKQLVDLAPDAGAGTVILVDPIGLDDTRQIGANTWNLPIILEQIYDVPASWDPPPRVYRATADWREYLVLADGSFRVTGDTVMAPASAFVNVDRSNVIVLHSGGGALTRRDRPLVVDEVEYALKPAGPEVLPSLPPGLLYELLLRTEPQMPD